jgi:hypothetical protein
MLAPMIRDSIGGVCMAAALLLFASSSCRSSKPGAGSGPPAGSESGLKTAAAFASIADPAERGHALFNEASRVLLHPRCANCHPADKQPRQGDGFFAHVPPVWGGEDGRGLPALLCASCHQERNYEALEMPGAPDWHLAPPEMVFIGKTPGEICEALKDNARNGGKTIEEIVSHVKDDKLVAWGFAPGPGRLPAPGTQETLGGLFRAWADAGAACPSPPEPEGAK